MIFRLCNDIIPRSQRLFEAFLWITFMGLRNNQVDDNDQKTLGIITLRLNFFNMRSMVSLKSSLPYSLLSLMTKRSSFTKRTWQFRSHACPPAF
jgi:hypothetical protein